MGAEWDRVRHAKRLRLLICCAAVGMVSGCSVAVESDPGVVCRDGYTAHPDFGKDQDGCGSHGGAVDANSWQDDLDAFLEAYPDGPPSHYVCRDGWQSTAVYQQGACSHHGGVLTLAWPDGTSVVIDGPDGRPVIVKPDGSTDSLDLS